MKTTDNNLSLISIPYIHGYDIIEAEKIIYLKGESNQTAIFIEGKAGYIISSACLGHYEKILPGKEFIRIHKSYIIHLKYLKRYIKGKFSHVLLRNNICLNVSIPYRDHFLALLGGMK